MALSLGTDNLDLPKPLPSGPPRSDPARSFNELSFSDLGRFATDQQPWLWDGFLVPGGVTLLTSRWKAGKTTLIALLLARLNGGSSLAGQCVRPGRAAIISEEGPVLWHQRGLRLPFGDEHVWFCRPFVHRPQPHQWLELLDHLAELHSRRGLDLVVIDPLATFLASRTENDASSVLAALTPLHRLTRSGVSVLLSHHPRKHVGAPGSAARGSGALSGFADILMELQPLARAGRQDRRRRLEAFSRYEQTPRELLLELTEDGADYLVRELPEADAEEVPGAAWRPVRMTLDDAAYPLSRQQILDAWPSDFPKPSDSELWRILGSAVAGERLRCAGSGRRSDPFRYWLPEREPVWCELYGTEWQSVSEAERATLYWRAKFLQDIDVLPKTNPGDEPPEAIMVVPRFERDPRDPPGVGSDW